MEFVNGDRIVMWRDVSDSFIAREQAACLEASFSIIDSAQCFYMFNVARLDSVADEMCSDVPPNLYDLDL